MAPGSLASVAPTLSPQMREKVFAKANEEHMEKMVGKMDTETQLKMGSSLKDDRVRNKFARATKDLEKGAKIAHRTDAVNKDQVGDYYDTLKNSDVGKLNFKDMDKNKEVMEGFISRAHDKDMESAFKSRENIQNISKSFNNYLLSTGRTLSEMDKAAQGLGNENLAKYFSGTPGQKLMQEPDKVIVRKSKEERIIVAPSPTP